MQIRVIILGMLVLASLAIAGPSDVPKIDLDNGVALTGNGRSLYTNPAAAADFRGTLADVGFYNSGDLGLVGQLTSNVAENIGVGVGMMHYAGTTAVTPGLGFATGKFHFGASTTFVPGTSGITDFTVGLRWDKTEDLSLGLVAYDVPHFKLLSAGIGVFRSRKIMAEIDANLSFDSGYNLNYGEARFALSYKPAYSVWMMARLTLPVAPQIVFDKRNIELGLHVWLTHYTALYVLFQNPLSEVFVGLKLRI